MGTILDAGALLEVVWASVAAGLGITVAASVGIASVARAGTERRAGRTSRAFGWTAGAVVAAVICLAAVVGAVLVMTAKG
ncbi:MAG TPA: hypothetical protein VK279_09220 [Solirubrobacteraceae bacterium]|nr:hypothetical protein [Solirubrobacteraceae bacterium]